MNELRSFLDINLGPHNNRVKHLTQFSRGVARMLTTARSTEGIWPYSCLIKEDSLNASTSPIISFSTQAMICTSCDYILDHDKSHRFLSSTERAALISSRISAESAVLAALKAKKPGELLWQSTTYGDEDVFTASWLLQMYTGNKIYESRITNTWDGPLR